MASDNVFAFKDCIPPGEPDPDLVELLSYLLGRAKSGDLRGIGYGTVAADGALGTGWCGADGTRDKLSSAFLMLHSRYAEALREAS